MSYLDVPRLHFSGRFVSDPSTANNEVGSCCDPSASVGPSGCSYNNAVTIDGNRTLEGWNKDGKHWFQFRDCVVRRAVSASGAVFRTASDDVVIGASVATTDSPRAARLVDLDPSYQFASQIFGMEVRISTPSGSSVTGKLETATLRELWTARAPGGLDRSGGVYQSILTDLRWEPHTGPQQSVILEGLRSVAALSIKFVVYAYNGTAGSPDFTVGHVVGTVGPHSAGEPVAYVPDRRVIHAGTSSPPFGVAPFNTSAFNSAPFKVDTARSRLVIDLGHALPESSPAGPRTAIGTLQAEIVRPVPQTPLAIGTIDYDRAHYLETAGVEELPLNAAQLAALATRPLRLRGGTAAVLSERPAGIHVDVEQTVVRLNPGENRDLEIRATQFGRAMANAHVFVGPSPGSTLSALSIRTGPGFATTLSPLPATVRTDATGRVTIRLVAGNPGTPRAHVDGQLSRVGLFLFSTTPANLRAEIAVRVFGTRTIPANPTWADVRDILTQYYRLYPSMRFLNLSDHATVRASRGAVAAALRRAETDPAYMPVTRDLSRDRKALLLRWLDAGAP